MSWINGLADKAEEILMKIDEKAANKLQKKAKSVIPTDETLLTEVTTVPSPVPPRRKASPLRKPPQPPVSQRSSPSVMVNQDEKLIDFLNDTSKPTVQLPNNVSKPEIEDSNQVEMLRNEVRVLNNELSLLLHRTRAAERESENMKQELEEAQKSHDNLKAEVARLVAQTQALEQRNQALLDDKRQLEEQSSGAHSSASQLHQQIQSLREDQASLTQRLEGKQWECAELESARQQQQQHTDSLTQQLAELQTELDQYRVRAQRTLSDKETLISQLRANNSQDSVETSFQTELAQLREERRALSEEREEAESQAETVRARLRDAEHTLEAVRENAARTQQELQERLSHETHRRRIIEDDFRTQTQELQAAREEWSSQRTQLNARLREREVEVTQLRSRPASPPHLLPGELEIRLSSLTKTLIQKQTALESATTERNQLRMQLEELEHKHREQLLLLHQARVLSANDTDDAKAQVPSFLVESPFDTGVARRVKRAYSSLDAVSIRTGVFLRRYPLARILVILYVVLLHMLVLLVLCSRTPDNAQK